MRSTRQNRLWRDFNRPTPTTKSTALSMHLKLAEIRLEEVTSLLDQSRYGDIPTAVAGFESEIRKAAWEMVINAIDEEGDIWSVASFLEESLERYTEILCNLTLNAPTSRAVPARAPTPTRIFYPQPWRP